MSTHARGLLVAVGLILLIRTPVPAVADTVGDPQRR